MTEERRTTDKDRWAEALTWYAALGERHGAHLTFALRRQWQVWYGDVENQRVFDDASRLLGDRARYRERQRPRKEELDRDQYDLSLPIAEWRRARSQDPRCDQRRPAGRGWWLYGGLGAAAVTVLLLLWPLRPHPARGGTGTAIYETRVGGLEEVHLRDGSSIILGGQTKVAVAFSAQRRSVRVIAGEAWFKVAHDRKWPFVVTAGDRTVTAVGTAFLVTRDSDRIVVTVTEGTVEVSARSPAWSPLRLVQRLRTRSALLPVPVSRGEELTFSDDGPLRPVTPADTKAATAWTHGRLMFDDQPLRYVVETINRYSSRHVVLGPSAAALRFSGIVADNDIDDWLRSLEVIYPVTESRQGDAVYVRMRDSTSESSQSLLEHHH